MNRKKTRRRRRNPVGIAANRGSTLWAQTISAQRIDDMSTDTSYDYIPKGPRV